MIKLLISAMKTYNYYFLLFFSILSFQSFGQEINSSVISQLTPEQIEIAKSIYIDENLSDEPLEDLPEIQESLSNDLEDIELDVNESLVKKFGYDFFSSMPTSVAAVGDLPLPNEYKISLRDQFTIILSGSKDAVFNLNVKLDGSILFPELGSVSVVGLTFKEVKEKLKTMIEQSYIGVDIDVSLQNLSAKKISIVGAVQTPGTYLVNPFSTITGALAYSGGILEIGSLRDIKLIRNTGEIFFFDLYDLLIKGDRTNDITIEAGDTLLISAAMQFVEIKGEVKRPAIYEILENENINDIVNYALGFTQVANKSNISISFLDLENAKVSKRIVSDTQTALNDALSIEVFSYQSKSISNIQVFGAVEEPGFYDLAKYKNLNQLIEDIKFVDVYPWLGVVEQFDDDNLIQTIKLFSLKDKSTFQSIELLPNSKVHFANIDQKLFDVSDAAKSLVDDYTLTINHKDNQYFLPVFGKYNVESFVNLLGLDMSETNKNATYINPLESEVIIADYREMQYVSKKYHNISFRVPVNDLITINILGAVDYPGSYVMKANSTLQDLYALVGSFKTEAFLNGIILTRESVRERQLDAIERSESALNKSILQSMQMGQDAFDLSLFASIADSIEPENLGRIAGNFSPNSDSLDTTVLFDGDSVIIPKVSNVISVVGEVLNPTSFQFNERLSIQSAIAMAGGYESFADKKRVYIIKANGLVQKGGRNIFAGKNGIEPGDTIVVPRKIISNNSALIALAPVTQILSDLAFASAAIDSLSNSN